MKSCNLDLCGWGGIESHRVQSSSRRNAKISGVIVTVNNVLTLLFVLLFTNFLNAAEAIHLSVDGLTDYEIVIADNASVEV